ncbi:MAG TPA: hypothetical protein VE035_01755 [Puia sp.]|nr:hypothetical protein [Puia sp.]
MKKIYFACLLFLIVTQPGCKKFIQQQEENAIVAAVTSGYWYVSEYLKNDSDITASFSGYLFKFDKNGTVVGTKDGASIQGVWTANIGAKQISSSFPSAGAPLKYLNETWNITDSYTNFVTAKSTDTTDSSSNILQLKKQ